jgi:hypothetical protein
VQRRAALDVLAPSLAQPVGLPMVRVSLHDRFSKSLGNRVFTPDEYFDGYPNLPGYYPII